MEAEKENDDDHLAQEKKKIVQQQNKSRTPDILKLGHLAVLGNRGTPLALIAMDDLFKYR